MEGGDLRVSSIDNRVVNMQFNNQQFEQGIKTTLSSLEALNKGLKLEGATKGLNDLSNTSRNISLGHIANGVDYIADKFRAMSIVAISALNNIVSRAVDSGIQISKSLTVDPITAGLHEYETKLGSIQTILANTAHEGTNLKQVTAALNELNHYSDQTIYNFGEMARNIGTFTAAGVTLKVATEAIKGIANLAAISGSNAQQASTAMYQLSQALAAGKVTLMDWNSVVNAGMGGKVFQDALMETARIHGVAIDKMVKDAGSFRNTLENGWLTGEILTETLSKFTGDLTAAQLKTMGYNQKQIAGILKMGQTAQDAATKVKTMSQLINTLQEAAGSGWAQTWELIFGDFEEARTLFTNVNNVIGGFISVSAEARNKVLGDWKELGGRTVLIEAISNAFNALIAVITPIKEAFREIFPKTTGKQLYELSVAIRNFTEGLQIGGTTANNIKRTFAGLFAVVGIGWDILKEVAKTLFRLFGVATEGSGSFLEITANIGDFLVELRNAIKEGNGLVIFFERVGNAIAVPLKLIGMFGRAISNLFDGFDAESAAQGITGFIAKFEPLTRLGDVVGNVWGTVFGVIDDIWNTFEPLAQRMTEFFGNLASTITSAISGVDYQNVLSTISTGAFAALAVTIIGFIRKFSGSNGILDSIKDSFDGLTKTMQSMQNTLRAATLLQIAVAIGVLTVSVVALSKIDSEGLTRALTAMTIMFGQLLASLALFEKMSGFAGLAKMPLVTAAFILLGVAINVLTAAVKDLAELDWNELAKGLTGVTVLMGVLVATSKLMANPAGLISTGLGMIALAAGIKILASAVTDLSGLSWEEMAKGLIGVGAILGALILFTKFAQANAAGVIQGAGIILLSVGIKILASALKDLSDLSWTQIAKGLVAMGGGLALIGAALNLIPPTSVISAAGVLIAAASLGMIADALKEMGGMSWSDIGAGLTALAGALLLIGTAISVIPPTAPLSAAGVLIVALALGKIGEALKQMGGMGWGEIAKGLVTLAGSLAIITVAMVAMSGALPGAAALLVVAASLAILTPILQTLGQMSWGEIGKGLLTLAAVFVILGVAGAVLTPVIPTLLGLGVAVTLLGAGMLLAGAGVLAFSVAMTALAVSGAAGAAAIVAIVSSLVGLIPVVMKQIALGVVAFAKVIATAGPAITDAITTVILALITAIERLTPKVVDVLLKLLLMLMETLLKYAPKIQDAGLKLLIALLNGIANNIGGVVTAATNIIVAFLKALGENQPRVLQAGVDLIISFINGLAKTIDNNSERMGKAGADLAKAIVKGMIKGLYSGASEIASAARNVAKQALEAAKDLLGISSPSKEFEEVGMFSDKGLARGFNRYSTLVSDAAEDVGKDALNSMKRSLSGIAEAMNSDVDMSPTIRPVLDLSDVQKKAGQISTILAGTRKISVTSSTSTAAAASSEFRDNQTSDDGTDGSSGGDITFNQYNTSPKALSSAEIYRQTNNQLSKAKEALPV